MSNPHIWLRAETKPQEQRTPLTPAGAGSLLDARFNVTIEDCTQRVFPIDNYRTLGCDSAESGTWTIAPREAFILGLKELPEDTFPLVHRHSYFAHVYQDQAGADETFGSGASPAEWLRRQFSFREYCARLCGRRQRKRTVPFQNQGKTR